MKKLVSKTGVEIVLKEQKGRTAVLIGQQLRFLPFGIDKAEEFIKQIGIL